MILINDYNLHGHFCKRAFNPLTSFHDLHFAKICQPCRLIISELRFFFFQMKLILSEFILLPFEAPFHPLHLFLMQSKRIGRKVKFAFFCQDRTQPLARLALKAVFHAETVHKQHCCCQDPLTNEGSERWCILSHCSRHVCVTFLLRKGTLAFQTEARSLTFREEGQFQFLLITQEESPFIRI